MNNKEHLAAMRKLGVRWKNGHALPTYTTRMTEAEKLAADKHYDAMDEDFIDSMSALRSSLGHRHGG